MKKIISMLLIVVLVFSLAFPIYAATISAPEVVYVGEDIKVTIVADNASGSTAKVFWIINGIDYITNASIVGGKWVAELTVLDPQIGTYTIDAEVVKYKGNGDPHSTEVAEAVTTTVKEPFVDVTAPVFSVHEDIKVEAEGPSGSIVTFEVHATDGIDGNVEVIVVSNLKSGDMFPLGTTTVMLTAVDKSNNVANSSFDVTVVDTTSPVLTVPNDMIVEATGPYGAIVSFDIIATDLVDQDVELIVSHKSGSTFPLGTTIVKVEAKDDYDNTSTKSFSIKVVDTTKPELTVPANMTVEATGPNGAVVNFDVSAVDIVDEDVLVEAIPGSGTLFPLGETTVEVKATDDSGNFDIKSFVVNVVDTTAPDLTDINDFIVFSLNEFGTPVNFEAIAVDLVDGDVPVIYSHPSGTMFKPGTTTVSYYATDSRGNKVEKSFKVTVKYNFSGFFKPVDMGADVVNVVKAGSAVPLKFSLSGYQGMSVFMPGYPMAVTGVYQPDMDYEVMPTIETAGKSGLSYDALTDQYTYVWKTDKAWAGTSKILVVKFSDGSVQTVNFKFNK